MIYKTKAPDRHPRAPGSAWSGSQAPELRRHERQ